MAKRAHRVEEFMSTALISLRETDRVSQAVREMTLAGIRHVPVVDARGHLAGLITSHDLMAALSRDADAELRSLMTRDVRTVRPDTPAQEAVALMIDQKFNALPVVNETGEVVGIITATDFLVVAYQALTGAKLERATSEV